MTLKTRATIIFFAALTSCSNQQTTAINSPSAIRTPASKPETEIKRLNDLLVKYEEPSQLFKVLTAEPTQVKGKQGTIISINPSDLTTESGEPLGKEIKIELKELMNQRQLLKANAQTVSSGQLLVSGGAYYINMTSDGKLLKLKEGKKLAVEFPKIAKEEMSLFYGKRDNLGSINWEQANESFKRKSVAPIEKKNSKKKKPKMESLVDYLKGDTSELLTKEEKLQYEKEEKFAKNVYETVKLKSLGWINCDRFLKISNKTDLQVKFNPSDSIVSANMYLVFKDINSVTYSSYFSYNGQVNSDGFRNIPVGYKVRLIAFALKDEKIRSSSVDLIVGNMQILTLKMKETSKTEFEKLFGN